MAGIWTAPADKAVDDIITSAIWNALLGATGALQYLHDHRGWRVANTSEQTMTGASAADIVTLTFDAPVTSIVRITGQFRKGSENAGGAASYFGLKVNSTVVAEADSTHYIAATSTNNQVESGIFEIILTPGSTNHQGAMLARSVTRVNASGAIAVAPALHNLALTAVLPAAAITSIAIRGANPGGAGPTLGVQNVVAEVLA